MNIIITGASSGIGYHVAKKFASQTDHRIFVLSRNGVLLEELAKDRGAGIIIPVTIDLSQYNYLSLDEALAVHRVSHIDIVIHNAGQLINKPFEELEAAEWEQVYRANVIGPAMLTRHLMPKMGGINPTHIIMISSMGGVNGTAKFPGLSAYSSSKGALTTLAECLSEEFRGRNISVNCLALGSVQTEMLAKAFPGFTTLMTPAVMADYIYEFSMTGWKYFNGKILPVSTGNP